jgi:hypothetical protein
MRDCHNSNLERSVYIQSPRSFKRVLHDGLGILVSTHIASRLLRSVLTVDSFFDEVHRITQDDYCPTEADVLRARTKTTGIYETRFQMGQLSIQ